MEYDTESEFWTIYGKTSVKKVCETIENSFGIKLKNYGSPMETEDHLDME